MGKLIVIEGLDGSGKETQTKKLGEYYQREGIPYKLVTFPDYDSPSSLPVRMYLNGELGGIHDVNAYEASTFFATDRIISYKTKWQQDYLSGTTILADRYTTSNAIYQLAKLPPAQWEDFLSWLWEYEFSRLSLPPPSLVIYLDVEPEISQELIAKRYQGNLEKRDIHEADMGYLHKSREAAFFAIEKLGWEKIVCTINGAMRSVEDIHKDIVRVLQKQNLTGRSPSSLGEQLIMDNKMAQWMQFYSQNNQQTRDTLVKQLERELSLLEDSEKRLEQSEIELEETIKNLGK